MSNVTDRLNDAVDLDGLFRRYRKELNGLAYSRLKDRDAAQDVVQDAFLRLLRRLAGEPVAFVADSPRFLLRRIVSNLTIDLIRQDRRHGRTVELDHVADVLIDPYPTADRAVVAYEDYALLKSALDELPFAARASLLLNRIEGLTHAEIGTRLGISASMVSKHIMNALKHCLKRMGHLH